MKGSIEHLTGVVFVFILFLVIGCATVKRVWTSKPEVQTSGNQYYEAQIEPLKNGKNFFVKFRLQVTNKTDAALKMDWNRTSYIRNGQLAGLFVFEGINPEDIKKATIPSDIIPTGKTFSKIIAPYRLLARPSLRERGRPEMAISAGILPPGENGIQLYITQHNRDIVERLTVVIEENATQ